ncbi:acyltransferase domain-containing protein [Streptomyces sp. M19]
MVQALRHGVLPRTLHVDAPTDKADWAKGSVALLTEPAEWPRGERVRRAGISAFGVGGTNAHVIVEEPPADEPAPPVGSSPARCPGCSPPPPRRRCATRPGGCTRTSPPTRNRPRTRSAAPSPCTAPASPTAPRSSARTAPRCSPTSPRSATAPRRRRARHRQGTARTGRTAFVFPGQGSQWLGMGRELAAAHPVFAAELDACRDALAPHTDWSLDDVLGAAPDPALLDRVDVVQPALFAVMVSLAALWRHHGVHPTPSWATRRAR